MALRHFTRLAHLRASVHQVHRFSWYPHIRQPSGYLNQLTAAASYSTEAETEEDDGLEKAFDQLNELTDFFGGASSEHLPPAEQAAFANLEQVLASSGDTKPEHMDALYFIIFNDKPITSTVTDLDDTLEDSAENYIKRAAEQAANAFLRHPKTKKTFSRPRLPRASRRDIRLARALTFVTSEKFLEGFDYLLKQGPRVAQEDFLAYMYWVLQRSPVQYHRIYQSKIKVLDDFFDSNPKFWDAFLSTHLAYNERIESNVLASIDCDPEGFDDAAQQALSIEKPIFEKEIALRRSHAHGYRGNPSLLRPEDLDGDDELRRKPPGHLPDAPDPSSDPTLFEALLEGEELPVTPVNPVLFRFMFDKLPKQDSQGALMVIEAYMLSGLFDMVAVFLEEMIMTNVFQREEAVAIARNILERMQEAGQPVAPVESEPLFQVIAQYSPETLCTNDFNNFLFTLTLTDPLSSLTPDTEKALSIIREMIHAEVPLDQDTLGIFMDVVDMSGDYDEPEEMASVLGPIVEELASKPHLFTVTGEEEIPELLLLIERILPRTEAMDKFRSALADQTLEFLLRSTRERISAAGTKLTSHMAGFLYTRLNSIESALHADYVNRIISIAFLIEGEDGWRRAAVLRDRLGSCELTFENYSHFIKGACNPGTFRQLATEFMEADLPPYLKATLTEQMLDTITSKSERPLRGFFRELDENGTLADEISKELLEIVQDIKAGKLGSIHGVKPEVLRLSEARALAAAGKLDEAEQLVGVPDAFSSVPHFRSLDYLLRCCVRYGDKERAKRLVLDTYEVYPMTYETHYELLRTLDPVDRHHFESCFGRPPEIRIPDGVDPSVLPCFWLREDLDVMTGENMRNDEEIEELRIQGVAIMRETEAELERRHLEKTGDSPMDPIGDAHEAMDHFAKVQVTPEELENFVLDPNPDATSPLEDDPMARFARVQQYVEEEQQQASEETPSSAEETSAEEEQPSDAASSSEELPAKPFDYRLAIARAREVQKHRNEMAEKYSTKEARIKQLRLILGSDMLERADFEVLADPDASSEDKSAILAKLTHMRQADEMQKQHFMDILASPPQPPPEDQEQRERNFQDRFKQQPRRQPRRGQDQQQQQRRPRSWQKRPRDGGARN